MQIHFKYTERINTYIDMEIRTYITTQKAKILPYAGSKFLLLVKIIIIQEIRLDICAGAAVIKFVDIRLVLAC